jgi:hypothetical protein
MKVLLSEWKENAQCVWCEKDKECVTTTFEDGFMKDSGLCWVCLQKAVRVRNRQTTKQTERSAADGGTR